MGIHWSPVDSPPTGPVIWSCKVVFNVSLNKMLNGQLNGQCFETWWCSCDMTVMVSVISLHVMVMKQALHDDVIKWKHFLRYWPFVRGIHRSPMNSPHKGQWRGALMFSLICAWINGWVNNGEASDIRHHRTHYDVIIMAWTYVHGWGHYTHMKQCHDNVTVILVSLNVLTHTCIYL